MNRLASLRSTHRLLSFRQPFFNNNARCASDGPSNDSTVKVGYELGLPLLTLPLPSRQEPCQFSLRPLSDTVETLCNNLQAEDKGLDYVALYNKEGVRISTSTSIDHLLKFGSFSLRLNDRYYNVVVPPHSKDLQLSSDKLRQLDDVKAQVSALYSALCVDEYKLGRERKLLNQLEEAEEELRPLQEHKLKIENECEAHSERIMWAGFASMSLQMGFFMRLTWGDYGWDVVEPITYFATYGTVVGTLGYYLYTKMPFEYPLAKDRIFTKSFYRRAQKQGFSIVKYNELVTEVEGLRSQLTRIRDPLFQHLPVSHLSKLENPSSGGKQ